jgi:hypothetical protein
VAGASKPSGVFDRLRKAALARRRRVSEVAAEVVAGEALPLSDIKGAQSPS